MHLKQYASGVLEVFGTLAALGMVLSYAFEERAPGFTLTFAISCAAASVYALAIGSLPFCLLEAAWAVIAATRWRTRRLQRETP